MQHAAVLVLTGLWVPARLEAAAGPRWGLMHLLMQRHLELQWRLIADRFVRDSSAGHRDLSPTDVDKRCRDKDAAAPNELFWPFSVFLDKSSIIRRVSRPRSVAFRPSYAGSPSLNIRFAFPRYIFSRSALLRIPLSRFCRNAGPRSNG